MDASRRWSAAACFLAAGCTGLVMDPGGGPGRDDQCNEARIEAQPLRRISSEQYHNVIRDLTSPALAAELGAVSRFPETVIDDGFANDAAANLVNTSESNAIEDNAAAYAAYVLERADEVIPELASCVEPGFSDADVDACMPTFIDEIGARAYRRPLTSGEREILQGLYDRIRPAQGARAAFASVMQLVFQAPALLYRTERGVAGSQRLSDYEMASRLSFFLRNSMPDEALMSAAREGRLSTVAEIETEARRLVEDERALEVVQVFHRDWLHSYQIAEASRVHEHDSPAVRAALSREVEAFVQSVFTEGDGTFATLMTTNRIPVPAALGPIYGVEGADGSLVEVENRHGILTLASVLGSHADATASAPIRRGYFIREAVLCGEVLLLPDDVDPAAFLDSTAGLPTARERLAGLSQQGTCSYCHNQFNPIGLGLENYDQLGVWRTRENDVAIDASGRLAVGELDASFGGPDQMIALIAGSEQAMACYATQWFRFAMGRPETEKDRCALAELQDRFIASGGDIRELMVAVATSKPFMSRVDAVEE